MKLNFLKKEERIGELNVGDLVMDSRGLYHLIKKGQIKKDAFDIKRGTYFYKNGDDWYIREEGRMYHYLIVKKGLSNKKLLYRTLLGSGFITFLFYLLFEFGEVYYVTIPLIILLFISTLFFGSLLYISLLRRFAC